jgi:exodeoxyribonuclease V alpha subunit
MPITVVSASFHDLPSPTTKGSRMTKCIQDGKDAEQRFAAQAQVRGWQTIHAFRDQDINEHWDVRITRQGDTHLVDVKARKRVNRHDADPQDEWVWIELHSVRPDNRGWLYDSQASLIAFECQHDYVIVPRQKLIALVEQHVTSRQVTSASEARYCIYQRSGRCDKITLIERKLLYPIAWDVWNWGAPCISEHKEAPMQLTPEQQAAVDLCLREKVSIVTGGPGTGKSTVSRAIIDAFKGYGFSTIALAAPTGKAARRLADCTDETATTVHRLLNHPDPGGITLCLVDEASMLDIELAEHLIAILPDHAHLIFVGDADQLPSVGPGKVLADLIEGDIPTARLTQIHRQVAGSQIIQTAHAIHEGVVPEINNAPNSDAFFFEIPDANRVAEHVARLVTDAIPNKFGIPVEEIAVIVPQYGKSTTSGCGIHRINTELQAMLNPPGFFKEERQWDFRKDRFTITRTLREGDRLVWTTNDYKQTGFVNGDETVVTAIWEEEENGKQITKVALEGAQKPVSMSNLTAMHGWAISVHKSQGSEYRAGVVVMHSSFSRMNTRRLLYTAVTRAKELLCLVGEKRALAQAIATTHENDRRTALVERLRVTPMQEAA